MRKFYLVGLALLATFMFAAVTAGSALAEEGPLWLVNGNDIASGVQELVDWEGEILWEFKSILGNIDVDCSVIYDGWVGSGGKDEITEILTLGKVQINEQLVIGTGLSCTSLVAGLCAANELVELWPDGMPWPTQLELMTAPEPEILDVIGTVAKPIGWHIWCTVAKVGNLCTGIFSVAMQNVTGGVEGTGSSAAEKCEVGSGLVETIGTNLILLVGGGTLTVSHP